MDSRSLVLWLGYRMSGLVDELDRRACGTIATSLVHADSNRSAIDRAHKDGLGLFVDGEAWRNQLPPGHPWRGDAFAQFGYRISGRQLNPDGATMTTAQQQWLVDRYVLAQSRFTPSAYLTPAHFSFDATGTARRSDLMLVERMVDQLAATPRARADGKPAGVFATVVVPADVLTDRIVAWLIDAYASLPVDGFWIWAARFNESAKRFGLVRNLALGLQARTGKPSVLAGLGHLWQAALRNGAAAVSTGPQRSKLVLPPPEPDDETDDEDEDDEQKRRTVVFHGAVLGGFSLNSDGQARERTAFQQFGCDCGHHASRTSPATERERRRHNVWWLMREARAASRGTAHAATGRLRTRIERAGENRALLRMRGLAPAWRHANEMRRRPGQAEGRAAS